MNKRVGSKTQKQSFWKRHPHAKHWLIGAGVVTVIIVALVFAAGIKTSVRQGKLAPFYATEGLQPEGVMGEIVRSEPMDIKLDGGTATRVLYRTQEASGQSTFSSGMIFVPNTPPPAGQERPVVAWAHGTLGMGEACAPTRSEDPMANIGWVSEMLKNGWVVTATDYAGLGTPGTQQYLVGTAEAQDVLNSVRAARNLPGSQAGNVFVVYGHSQGGHSALFTADRVATYAPELSHKGTIAAAPAAELVAMLGAQENNVLDWVIGPEILVSWPTANSNLSVEAITSKVGQRSYKKIAEQCIAKAALGGMIRDDLKQTFFDVNPIDNSVWLAEAQKQTAPLLQFSPPLLVVESTSDQVILPSTTALYIKKSCDVGANISTLWIGDTPHQNIPDVVAPQVTTWINDRFAEKPNIVSCDQQLPVAPYGT